MGGRRCLYNKMCNCSICLSIHLLLFVCNHLEDWDKISHAQLGSVGDSFKTIKFEITVFPLAVCGVWIP